MSMITVLTESLREVAKRRAERDALTAEIKSEREAFEATIAHKVTQVKALAESVAMAEAQTKALGLAHYETTQEKKPTPGVEVKVGKVFKYDPAVAFAWAKEKGLCLIPEKLDEDALVTLAKATPLPFGTIEDDPKVQLSKDLSSLLVEPAPAVVSSTESALTPAELEKVPF